MNKPSNKNLALIIANEFCERFCYYGFRALLFQFLRDSYAKSDHSATKIVHFFNFTCYTFTFAGGILSDNIIGRYNTIMYLSIVYLIGTVLTTLSAVYSSTPLLFLGLLLIAVGTGGIKPCVSTFGGDQFAKEDKGGVKRFFSIFYFAINSGSLISIFLSPIISRKHCLGKDTCYCAAFGLPAFLLGISCILFFAGKSSFIIKKPKPDFLSKMVKCALIYIDSLLIGNSHKKTACNRIIEKFGALFYQDIVRMLKVLKVFLLVPIFWMLYDQQTTTWIKQGTEMNKHISIYFTNFNALPSQMQALNGVLILILIPLFVKVIYPTCEKYDINLNSLHRMALGIIFISLSFFNAAIIQYFIPSGIHILWQVPQYLLLTIGEVFLSMTGIEFVYSHSPESMKGIVLSFWLLTVAVGNLYVILFTSLDLANWLGIRNAEIFNFVAYGLIGVIASFYFLRQSKSFKFT